MATDNSFRIEVQTYTLSKLLDGSTQYIIPVYQRPYSWEKEQVTVLMNDILEGCIDDEDIFIGTMQLSGKVSNNPFKQDVIDGQQRITTLSILLKELSKSYPENERLKALRFDWLETRVGNEQAKDMNAYFHDDETEQTGTNHYVVNACLIRDFINKSLAQDNESIDVDTLVDYLFDRLQFVVIETHAGLSKTLKIFNTINASGLDLNAGDLFKLRMYEYMSAHLNEGEEAFKEIKALYDKIKGINKKAGKEILTLGKVLDVYKTVLIGKHGMKEELHDKSWRKFFDQLFDSILVKANDKYKYNKGKLRLDLKKMETIAEIRERWYYLEKDMKLHKDTFFALKLLRESRYGSYWKIVFPYIFAHRDEKEHAIESACDIVVALNKLLFIYSIHHRKVVKEIRRFWYKLLSAAVNLPATEIIRMIDNEKLKVEGWVKKDLGKNIWESNRWKNLICKLSEYLRMRDEAGVSEINKLLFDWRFDIEHIHAIADRSSTWNQKHLYGIGNLAMLESSKNRSIGNKPFSEKKKEYLKSKYVTLNEIAAHNDDWTEADAEKRREEEVEKMFAYLYLETKNYGNKEC